MLKGIFLDIFCQDDFRNYPAPVVVQCRHSAVFYPANGFQFYFHNTKRKKDLMSLKMNTIFSKIDRFLSLELSINT